MKATILNKLEQIETEKGIKILFACESGSRGWGFPSPDSDFDVRFIYVHPFNHYLSVMEKKEQLDFAINDALDINGWDLQKVLQLMRKSNTTAFEWLQSPVIYKEEPFFREELWNRAHHYFSPRVNVFHYLGIAKKALESTENEIKIKKLFYVLRPLLCAKWCLEKNEIAPMTITPLLSLVPTTLAEYIKEL